MLYKNLLPLFAFLLVACQADAIELSSTPVTATPQFSQEITHFADEFQMLRGIPGQFGGGEYHADVDQWQGRKHRAMLALGEELDGGNYGRARLIDLMGSADHILIGGEALFDQIQSLPEYKTFAASDEFLVYEWRSTHDFMFFAIQDDRVIGSGWWYAGE